MTLDEYARWLENRIAVVGQELEVLLNARRAMEMARGEIDGGKAQLPSRRAKPSERKQGAPRGDEWGRIMAAIPQMIIGALPTTLVSGDFIRELYPDKPSKRDKDRVYAALSYMKSNGLASRSATGGWTLSPSAALKEGTNGQ